MSRTLNYSSINKHQPVRWLSSYLQQALVPVLMTIYCESKTPFLSRGYGTHQIIRRSRRSRRLWCRWGYDIEVRGVWKKGGRGISWRGSHIQQNTKNIQSESTWCKWAVFCTMSNVIRSATSLSTSLNLLCNPYLLMLLQDIILCINFQRIVSTFTVLYITIQDGVSLIDNKSYPCCC